MEKEYFQVIMSKFEWVFFDLDGTLANSLSVMYQVYDEFLQDYGYHGNKEEFNRLNGPTLFEIIKYLKTKYNLKESIENLRKKYQKKIEQSYIEKVKPADGSENLLKVLKDKGLNLALVTSSTKKISENFLLEHDWKKYFSIIVYGDEILKSKPESDIYNLCLIRTNANKRKVLVVEDSKNGYQSAINAGLQCINISDGKNDLTDLVSIIGI